MNSRGLSLLAEGESFLEWPRWHRDRSWVSDFYREAATPSASTGRSSGSWRSNTSREAWGWLPDGSLLVVSMKDQRVLQRDGCTLDAQGHVWAADEVGGRCVRVAPGGAIVDEIHTPEGWAVSQDSLPKLPTCSVRRG